LAVWEPGFEGFGIIMADIRIYKHRCKGCCLCVSQCPVGNIRMSEVLNEGGFSYAEIIDAEECTGCGLCCLMCPDVAIEIGAEEKERIRIEEIGGVRAGVSKEEAEVRKD